MLFQKPKEDNACNIDWEFIVCKILIGIKKITATYWNRRKISNATESSRIGTLWGWENTSSSLYTSLSLYLHMKTRNSLFSIWQNLHLIPNFLIYLMSFSFLFGVKFWGIISRYVLKLQWKNLPGLLKLPTIVTVRNVVWMKSDQSVIYLRVW